MGTALVLASTSTKPPSSTVLVTNANFTSGLPHGNSFPPRLSPKSWTTSPTTSSVAPERSTRRRADRNCWSLGNFMTECSGSTRTWYPTMRANMDTGAWARKHHLHPMVSVMTPPRDAPRTAPKPTRMFCMAWYIPRCLNGIMSELITVAAEEVSTDLIEGFCFAKWGADTHSDQSASAESCQAPHDIELQDCLGYRTAKAANHERNGRNEEANPPPKHVREASIQRLEGRARNQVGSRKPCCIVGGIELGPDGGVGRCRDGTVEPGKKDIGPESYRCQLVSMRDSIGRLTCFYPPETRGWRPGFGWCGFGKLDVSGLVLTGQQWGRLIAFGRHLGTPILGISFCLVEGHDDFRGVGPARACRHLERYCF